MKVKLRKISSLSPREIINCCPDCLSMLFADSGPIDLSTVSITKWLSERELAESNGDDVRFVLWEHGDYCGPTTMVSITRVFAELDFAQLKCFYNEPTLRSGLATAACQAAISHAFEQGFTSRILAKASISDPLTRDLYSSIPLSVFTELTALGIGASQSVPYEIQKANPIWHTWNYNAVLKDAESRLKSGREIVDWSEQLMGLDGRLNSQTA